LRRKLGPETVSVGYQSRVRHASPESAPRVLPQSSLGSRIALIATFFRDVNLFLLGPIVALRYCANHLQWSVRDARLWPSGSRSLLTVEANRGNANVFSRSDYAAGERCRASAAVLCRSGWLHVRHRLFAERRVPCRATHSARLQLFPPYRQ